MYWTDKLMKIFARLFCYFAHIMANCYFVLVYSPSSLSLYRALSSHLPLPVSPQSYDSPHTKAFLLFQAHFSQAVLPIADYLTDTKSVLDQSLRILQVKLYHCR